jgi:adenine-specific DNA-methyltransferase
LGIDLIKEKWREGYIIPNTLLTQDYYKELRNMLLESCKISSIVNFSDLPFKDAVVENIILILEKSESENLRVKNQVGVYAVNPELHFIKQKEITQNLFIQNAGAQFIIGLDESTKTMKEKIENATKPLGDFLDINQAIALKYDRAKYLGNEKKDETYKKVIDGRNIGRYSLEWDRVYLKYDINAIHSCKREDIFLTDEKLFFRRVGGSLTATLDKDKFYALNTIVVMNKKANVDTDIRYFLGLFNSKLMNYYYINFLKSTKKVFSEIQARQVKYLPIRIVSHKEQALLIHLVDRILLLNRRLKELPDQNSNEAQNIKSEIEKTDAEIDHLVYELYGLTEKEIKTVEDTVK